MSPDVLDLLIQAVIALMSLAAFVVSIVAIRRTGPRLRIRASTGVVVFETGDPPFRTMILVEVTNNGGSEAIVGQVTLQSADGPDNFAFVPSPTHRGPALPYRLDANGGRATWMFDYAELRKIYETTLRDEELVLRPFLRIGAKVLRSRSRVVVNRPDDPTSKFTLRQKVNRFIRDWTHPRVQLSMMIRVPAIDLDRGLAPLAAENYGRWWSRPFTVTLVTQRQGSDTLERVDDVDQVRFPRIPPRRSRQVLVPLLDDPAPDEELKWVVTAGPGLGASRSALTWENARTYKASWTRIQDNGTE